MIKELEMRIPYLSLLGVQLNSYSEYLYKRFRYLIDNKVVLHNEKLGIDYILTGVEVQEELFSSDQKVKVRISILNEIDKETLKQLNTLRESILSQCK